MFFSFWKKPARVYLDYAAATPVHRSVVAAMQPYFTDHFGNASAIHTDGQVAKRAVESARLAVARTLGVRPTGVVWTASGTEANNLAIYGYVRFLVEERGQQFSDIEIISTLIEHPSILSVLEHLAAQGVKVTYAPVTEEGRIDQKAFSGLLNKHTALVCCTYVNSEVGTVEDVRRLSRVIKKHNTEHGTDIKLHVDAAQAPLWLPCQLEKVGADLLTLDTGKCYGPKGVGVLAFTHNVTLKGVTLGGGQERGLRAGTENTPLVVGAAKAIERAQKNYQERSEKVARLRDYLWQRIGEQIPGVALNGSTDNRVANNVNISIPDIDGEYATVWLDVHGVSCSTRSACGSNKTEVSDDQTQKAGVLKTTGSHVVRTLTNDPKRATSTIRFSLGEETTKKDLFRLVKALVKCVDICT